MAVDVKAIREALAAAAKNTGVLGQVSPWMLAQPTPPAGHVIRGRTEYHLAGSDGLDEREFAIQAFVGLTTDIGAAQVLDSLLDDYGPTSMKAALEADRELGGLVDDLKVIESSGEQVAVIEGRGAVLMSEWTVRVLASGAA